MTVCGFSIARNAVRFGYPLEASLRSLLPLVDEIVLNVGQSDDGTWELVQAMREPRIKAFRSTWDLAQRRGGCLLAQQTNIALDRCRGDWGFCLQADEVLHEDDYPAIRDAFEWHRTSKVEALSFRYHHFYGSFQTVQDHPHRWYPRAIRAVKLGIGATSRGDAMDFGVRRHGREGHLLAHPLDAYIYHYGWARPPAVMFDKQKHFETMYQDDAWIEDRYAQGRPEGVYRDLGHLRFFRGTHPEVMRSLVAGQDWRFHHGIEQQSPEWLRHSYVWARRRLRHHALALTSRIERVRQIVTGSPAGDAP